jgi:hypothetical protein
MHKRSTKLSLSLTTIRNLDAQRMSRVAGGRDDEPVSAASCPTVDQPKCGPQRTQAHSCTNPTACTGL